MVTTSARAPNGRRTVPSRTTRPSRSTSRSGPRPRPARTDLDPHLPRLRAVLEQQRQFRTEQLAGLAAGRPASAPHAEVDRALRAAAAVALADIEGALGELAHGTYGRCRECAAAIALERLEVLPSSTLCPSCQDPARAAG